MSNFKKFFNIFITIKIIQYLLNYWHFSFLHSAFCSFSLAFLWFFVSLQVLALFLFQYELFISPGPIDSKIRGDSLTFVVPSSPTSLSIYYKLVKSSTIYTSDQTQLFYRTIKGSNIFFNLFASIKGICF